MFHKITIAGNVGRDPEMRYMPDGKAVTNFSVAVSDGWGDKKKTVWFRVAVWGKRAEVANEYISKGSKILVEGRLKTGGDGNIATFTRSSGEAGANFEINANDFVFLSGKGDNGGGGDNAPQQSSSAKPAVEEDDIPF